MRSRRRTSVTRSIFLLSACATFLVSACTSGVQASLLQPPKPSPRSRLQLSGLPALIGRSAGAIISADPTRCRTGHRKSEGLARIAKSFSIILQKTQDCSRGRPEIVATTNGYEQQCWYGTCRYSSAMLKTAGHFQQQYGIFSAYIKLPAGRGLWPAFWMTGANGGEIDIIEVNNQHPNLVEGFVHSPQVKRGLYLHLQTSLYATYHEFSVEWTSTGITWLIDGRAYGHVHTTPGANPFNQSFSLILDLAVGGTWPGAADSEHSFSSSVECGMGTRL